MRKAAIDTLLVLAQETCATTVLLHVLPAV